MPKSPSWASFVIQVISARSRTLRARSSNSRLTTYSNAAPSHVHVPCPTPTRNRCRSPRRIRSTDSASAAAACAACSAVQTESVLPSGPSPGVLSNRSAGPVALIRNSYGMRVPAAVTTNGVGSAASPSGWISRAASWTNSIPCRS